MTKAVSAEKFIELLHLAQEAMGWNWIDAQDTDRGELAVELPSMHKIETRILALAEEAAAQGADDAITDDTLITGAQWRAFYQGNWPGKDWYIDDIGVDFEDERGDYILPDDGLYRLGDFGMVCWQGPKGQGYENGQMFPVSEFYIRHLQQKPAEEVIVLRVPADQREALLEAAKAAGATHLG